MGSKAIAKGGGVSVKFKAYEDVEDAMKGGMSENNSAVLAMHINDAQCGHCGVFLIASPTTGEWRVGATYGAAVDAKFPPWKSGKVANWGNTLRTTTPVWHTLAMNTSASGLSATLDGEVLFTALKTRGVQRTVRGWVGIGTSMFAPMLFDAFAMDITV